MKNTKQTIALLFGGKSAEHEVSVRSARYVAAAIDATKYRICFIAIDREGRWILSSHAALKKFPAVSLRTHGRELVAFIPGSGGTLYNMTTKRTIQIGVVFPVLHGPNGEDGTVQGVCKSAGVPYVGASVLGSAVGMDKDVMKRLLRDAGLPIGKFITIAAGEPVTYPSLVRELGTPLFVKPANMGSSIGVRRVASASEFAAALHDAFRFDTKVLVEEYIAGREIECSVIGNEAPAASIPGEIVVHDTFYSYDTKYVSSDGASLVIPAPLIPKAAKEVRQLAERVCKVLCAEGLARVDFFYTKAGKWYVNEINTLPGFTAISMYPKLWEATGLSGSELVARLIALAVERHARESAYARAQ